MPLKCQYCKSILSCDSTLIRHQKTVKKCIEIQLNFDKNDHKNELLENKDKDNSDDIIINELLNLKDNIINELRNQNNEYKIKIKELELWKETTIKELKISNSINNTSKNNINSNNNINNILLYTPDLSRENIQKVCEMINPEILMKEDGLASLFVEQIAKDKDGNYGIINTNKKNICYQFKNKNGEIIKDSNGLKSTQIFIELSRIQIEENLKKIENKKNMDLTDYSVIEENVMDEKKLKKNIGIKLHIDNVKNDIIKQDLIKKGKIKEYKNEMKDELEKLELELKNTRNEKINWKNIKIYFNGLEIIDLDSSKLYKNTEEHELKNTRNEKINCENIKINFTGLEIIDLDSSRLYKNTEEHEIKVLYYGIERSNSITTYDDEKNKFIQYEKEKIKSNFIIENYKKIKLLEKDLKYLDNNKWYMKKRMKDERKEIIKIRKKNEKLEEKSIQEDNEEIFKLIRKEFYWKN
jgi:hypothetical protein